MKNKIRKLLKSNVFQNVGYLTAGNLISQLIALIGAFFIPKLLGVQQYGIYNTVLVFVSIFTVFTFEGFNKVIIREAAKDASNLKLILESFIGLRNLFSLLAPFIVVVVTVFTSYESITKLYIAVYSLSLLVKGFESSVGTIFQSQQKMKVIGYFAFIRQLIKVPISILLLYLNLGILSLLIAHILIEAFIFFSLYKKSKKIVNFNFFSKVRIERNFFNSGLRFSLISFLNILSGRIDLVMLSFLTTPEKVGIYALAYNLVNKGLVFRNPISQAIFPYYANKFKQLKPSINLLIKHSLTITIPLVLLLFPSIFFIKPIITYVLGVEFVDSSRIFSILIFYLVFNYAIIPWGLGLQVTSNEKFSLIGVVVCAILNIILNIVFFEKFGLIGIAYSTLIVELIRLILNVFFIKKILKYEGR